jgi:hypothetical protein
MNITVDTVMLTKYDSGIGLLQLWWKGGSDAAVVAADGATSSWD